MKGVNKVILIGRLGAEPTIKTIGNDKVANFSLATSETYIDKTSGEQKTITDWHRITAYSGLAKIVEQHFKKGLRVYIEGKLKHREYKADNGETRYITDIRMESFVFLNDKKN